TAVGGEPGRGPLQRPLPRAGRGATAGRMVPNGYTGEPVLWDVHGDDGQEAGDGGGDVRHEGGAGAALAHPAAGVDLVVGSDAVLARGVLVDHADGGRVDVRRGVHDPPRPPGGEGGGGPGDARGRLGRGCRGRGVGGEDESRGRQAGEGEGG